MSASEALLFLEELSRRQSAREESVHLCEALAVLARSLGLADAAAVQEERAEALRKADTAQLQFKQLLTAGTLAR